MLLNPLRYNEATCSCQPGRPAGKLKASNKNLS
ncbi:MAG: hypothetical protein DMF68_14530 [Acidobacteria bacterium]|nr:MAG: hypothetical protein DMF68_14530 [Acidobacteriota bacterium]